MSQIFNLNAAEKQCKSVKAIPKYQVLLLHSNQNNIKFTKSSLLEIPQMALLNSDKM